MAPFTRPAFVSTLRRSMIHAPTAKERVASNPAVMLQSLLSLPRCSDAFLFHLRVLLVSSVHGSLCTYEVKRPSIVLLKSSHCFLLGKRQTGDFPDSRSWTNLSTLPSMTRLAKVLSVSAVGELQRTQCNMVENLASFRKKA